MLEIVIGPNKEGLISRHIGEMRVFTTLVESDGKYTSLQSLPLFRGLEEVRLTLFRRILPIKGLGLFQARRLTLPLELQKAIIQFLETYHAQENMSFDCYAFANLVAGQPSHQCRFLRKFWWTRPLEKSLRVGSVVFLLDVAEDMFKHAAIYIGYNRYISVYGAGGDLEVSTLPDMMRDFRAKQAFEAFVPPRATTA